MVDYVCSLGAPRPLAGVVVRLSLTGMKTAAQAGGKTFVGVMVTRLLALPWVAALTDKLTELVGMLAGGEVKARADLAAFFRGDLPVGDVNTEALALTERLNVRALQDLAELRAATDSGQAQMLDALAVLEEHLLALEKDAERLPLRPPVPDGRNFLYYASGRIQFVGRDVEIRDLQDWAASEAKFSWRLVYGPGGTGKSRLAYELCTARMNGWITGFHERSDAARLLERIHDWRPVEPTLIVIDYAGLRPVETRQLLLALQATSDRFAVPVRVLLLERDGEEGEWYRNRFWPGGNAEAAALAKCRGAEPLALGNLGLDEIIALMLDVAGGPQRLGDMQVALQTLVRIDPQARALFAAMVADALADGQDAGHIRRDALIRNRLARDERELWRSPPERDLAPTDPGLLAHQLHLNALMLATIVGMIPMDRLTGLHARLPDPTVDEGARALDPSRLTRMHGRQPDGILYPLEPDLLGELFVLDRLVDAEAKTVPPQDLINLIWRAPFKAANWIAAATFLDRCANDYPELFAMGPLRNPPASPTVVARLNWCGGIMSTLSRLRPEQADIGRALYEDLKVFAGDDPACRFEAAGGGMNLLGHWPSERADEGLALFENLKAFAGDDPACRLQAAQGGFNLLIRVSRADPDLARTLFENLMAFVGDDPACRLVAAKGGYYLLDQVGEADPDLARTLFGNLKAFAGDDPACRLEAAEGGMNLLARWPSERADEGLALFEKLKAFARDDLVCRLRAAQGGSNLLMRIREADPDLARTLLENLRAFAGDDPARGLVAALGGVVLGHSTGDRTLFEQSSHITNTAISQLQALGSAYPFVSEAEQSIAMIRRALDQ